ncbi:MAG: HEAT repeat domain-containing protein, partial [Myxococcota bacterium]
MRSPATLRKRLISVPLMLLSTAVLLTWACGDNLAVSQEKLRAAESPLVRASAAERLGEIGDDQAVRSLTLFGLRDASPIVRAASAKALAGNDHPQVMDLLGEALMDNDAGVMQEAASALASCRHEKARRYLELAYMRSDSEGKAILAQPLLAAGASPREVIEEMAKRRTARALTALEDGTQAERVGALLDLGRAGTPEARAALLDYLEARPLTVAAAAASALGEGGGPEVIPALVGQLEEAHPTLRQAVLKALGRLGEPSAAPAIVPLVLEEEGPAAVAAAEALADLDRTPEVLEALCEVAFRSDNRGVLVVAVKALQESGRNCDLATRLAHDLSAEGSRLLDALAIVKA